MYKTFNVYSFKFFYLQYTVETLAIREETKLALSHL